MEKMLRAISEPARIVAQLRYQTMKLRRSIAPGWSKGIDEKRRQRVMKQDVDAFSSNAVLAVGVPRSGTTLLASLLAQRENTVVLSEPFLQQFHQGFFRWTDLSGQQRVSIQPVNRFISEWCQQSMRLSTVVVKETWRSDRHDVYPNHEFLGSLVDAGVPTIAIVRDPRAVWYSSCSRYGAMDPATMASSLHIAEWNVFAEWLLARQIPYLRYEDLVRSPETWFHYAFRSLGLPEGRFENHLAAKAGLGDERALEGGSVNTDSLEKFRKLDVSVLDRISEACSSMAQRLGYTGDFIGTDT